MGVAERSFRISGATGPIPGVAWLPPGAGGLVLLGHGGSGDKRSPRIVELATWFAANGLAAAAIDGPYHGERVPAPVPAPEYQARMVADGIDDVLDRMTADWLAVVRHLGFARVGYLGVSLGTRFGLPLAAALGDRLQCAVLGKFGLRQHPAMPAGLATPERAVREARAITAPVLFHVQWDDEIFPRDGQLALFDALAAPGKQLIAYAGGHGASPPGAVEHWRTFVHRHLGEEG
ncbi:dienelactone hydrolase family protein [Hamadaea sp. NPDC051192]|uniref:dienelactone hydrolase family protein n=1 Tax=Hamadaea sp. NPDC051192 TaxID=3154940 RepID=UPI00342E1E81